MSTQNQYLSALDFGVTITLINRRCFNAKIWLPFQRFFFQASYDYLTYLRLSYWYGYLFKHHDLSTRLFLESTQINIISIVNLINESMLTNGYWIKVDVTLTNAATLFQYIQFSIYSNIKSTLSVCCIIASTISFIIFSEIFCQIF